MPAQRKICTASGQIADIAKIDILIGIGITK